MKHPQLLLALTTLLPAPTFALRAAAATPAQPNVLFIIADDASSHFGEAYGCNWVKTPHIDRLAKQGLVFDNAYTPTSKCAPSRAAILTGRNPWQLEAAANPQPYFPAKFMAFSEALAAAGIACGSAGKTWGPGEAKLANGNPRNFGLRGHGSVSDREPGPAFSAFLKTRAPRQGDVFDPYPSPRSPAPTRRRRAARRGKSSRKPPPVLHSIHLVHAHQNR